MSWLQTWATAWTQTWPKEHTRAGEIIKFEEIRYALRIMDWHGVRDREAKDTQECWQLGHDLLERSGISYVLYTPISYFASLSWGPCVPFSQAFRCRGSFNVLA